MTVSDEGRARVHLPVRGPDVEAATPPKANGPAVSLGPSGGNRANDERFARPRAMPSARDVLALQRLAGNRATGDLLRRAGKGSDGAVDGYVIRREEEPEEPAGGRVGGRVAGETVVSRVPPATPVAKPRALTKSTVGGPTSSPYGEWNWVIQWKLDRPSPAGGWIIQRVDFSGGITGPGNTAVATGWEPHAPYWEAWHVNAGQAVTDYAEGGDVLDDTYANPAYASNTKGTVTEAGRADFYEGLTLPAGFAPIPGHPAGILPTTKTDPGHLRGATSAVTHNLTAKWDSAVAGGATTVSTV